jgi:tetratricopeptide (TPR) repeat protein
MPPRHRDTEREEGESGRAGDKGTREELAQRANSPRLPVSPSPPLPFPLPPLRLCASVALLLLYFALLSACSAANRPVRDPADSDDLDARIAYYEKKIEEHPTVAAAHAKVGVGYLQKAKETHNVDWLQKARRATQKSIEIQASLEAYRTMAAICSFAHQFPCAVEWGKKAVRTRPQDYVSVAILADAYLRTRNPELALETLNLKGSDAENSYELAEARGLIFSELGRMDEARDQYQKAQLLASKRGDKTLELRARVNLAGTYIDTQKAAEARAILIEIKDTNGISKAVQQLVQIHRAELAELDKEYENALRLYQGLTEPDQHDPDLYRKCYHLARTIGDKAKADDFFKKAEAEALAILKKGEEFSLECLANLYAESEFNLEQAEKYALRNLELKQDKSARQTLDLVISKRRN